MEGVGIYGQAVATVKVADDLDGIVKYAEQFLGKDQKDIQHEISEVLNSNLRAILSKMTVEQINKDRESFNEQVREIALISVMEFFLLNIYLCMLIPSNFIFICIPC